MWQEEIEDITSKGKAYSNTPVVDVLVFGFGETVNSLELFKVERLED